MRHGQYHVKEKKREDKLLTELGHKQAHATGEWFRSRGIKPTEFIISTMPRAKQTAENILTEMGDLVQEDTIHRTEMIEEGAPPTAPVPKRKYYESDEYKRYLHADGSRIEGLIFKEILKPFLRFSWLQKVHSSRLRVRTRRKPSCDNRLSCKCDSILPHASYASRR